MGGEAAAGKSAKVNSGRVCRSILAVHIRLECFSLRALSQFTHRRGIGPDKSASQFFSEHSPTWQIGLSERIGDNALVQNRSSASRNRSSQFDSIFFGCQAIKMN